MLRTSLAESFRSIGGCWAWLRAAAFVVILVGGRVRAADAYVFTTVAGAPGFGYVDGTPAESRFGEPNGLAIDDAANVYVADNGNFVIRKITSGGNVSTIAGQYGMPGYADGTGDAARFRSIMGMAIDAAGNLYVCDMENSVIRKITPGGVVTTFAGKPGVYGAMDGQAGFAQFYSPYAVAVDKKGDVFVADTFNHAIRKISGGMVTTLAGTLGVPGSADGVGGSAAFNRPCGIAVDAAGNVFVADSGNETVRKITADGTVTTVAGSAGVSGWADGVGGSVRFYDPRGITVDGRGAVWIADRGNCAVRRLNSDGSVGSFGGPPGNADGAAEKARMMLPAAVAVDPAGYVYIADAGNSTVRKLMPPNVITTIAGASGIGASDGIRGVGSFFLPRGVAVNGSGTLFVVDTFNQAIRKVTQDGTTALLAGKPGQAGSADGAGTDARFAFPHNAAVDSKGNVYVTDSGNGTVRKITTAGVVFTFAGQAGKRGSADGVGSAALFSVPEGIAVDAAGNVFVTDQQEATIRKITPEGVVSTFAGTAGQHGQTDGQGSLARFDSPSGLAVDTKGNLYVADEFAYTIRKISPTGLVTTLAGKYGWSDLVDGTGANARFYDPVGVAVDAAGNVFVTEMFGNVIRKITPTGAVSTLGGKWGAAYGDGLGDGARFNGPAGIAVDGFGNLYVADYFTSVIRKGGLFGGANPPSALVNASVRANITSGQRLIVGFATSGSKPILVRSIGPGLSPYVSGITLAKNPTLELYSSIGTELATNDDWGGATTLSAAFTSVGAFPLDPKSADAALLRSVDGTHSVHTTTSASGMGLIELYDTDQANRALRITNLSARYQVGKGSDVLVAGFVISGSAPKTVLIRGVGFSLKQLFGISEALTDPILKVYNANQQMIAANDNWNPTLATTFSSVGAFELAGIGPDAAMLLSLPPGGYTAQLSGVGDTTGNGMIEVYEVGN
jgi:sugar lactone lactonase YvrE